MKQARHDHYVVSRRSVLKWSGAAGMLAVTGGLSACVPSVPPGSGGSDENGLILPPGFTSRVIARGGEKVAGTGFDYRIFPDGAATIADAAVAGGWYHVVNHEVPFGGGGVTSTAIRAQRRRGRQLFGVVEHESELRRRPHPVGHVAVV